MVMPVSMAYFDWAATTPLCDEAAEAMRPYLIGGIENLHQGGNANSLHSLGRRAFAEMEQARNDVAQCISCRPDELFFTCGATESDNTAILGIVNAVIDQHRKKGDAEFIPHIVVSSIEHEAVLKPVDCLRRQGIQVSMVRPDAAGFISEDALNQAMQPNTVLVSVMLANNEVGSIQPIGDLVRVAHERGALFHTDAAQAFGKIPLDCHAIGVDAVSLSAHKICGPKGVGALFLRKGTPCQSLLVGGGQESGFRSGTQNVAGMVGFAAAAKACAGSPKLIYMECERLGNLRDDLYAFLKGFPGVRASVPCEPGSHAYLPNIVHVTVEGMESETMILRLDRDGVFVSGGSACSSKSLEPSHVLVQLGMNRDRALGALRVSMGRYTTLQDVEIFKSAFARLMEWAR